VNAFFLNEPLREHYVCDAIINNKRQTKTKTNKKTTKKAKRQNTQKKTHKKHTKTQIQNRNRSGQYNT
jgi:hypothetical protein